MKVIIFGTTGMIGQGALRECLLAPDVEKVLSVVRTSAGRERPKLREVVHRNFLDFSPLEGELTGFDAAFFCLGVSSVGMDPEQYRVVTFDISVAAGRLLAKLNPGMTFIYVSGMGTDSSERGRVRWARVKGQTENALLQLPFKAAYMLRPALIQPMHGITSKTGLYRAVYAITAPLIPALRRALPKYFTTTEQMGRAMLALARRGGGRGVLENADINQL